MRAVFAVLACIGLSLPAPSNAQGLFTTNSFEAKRIKAPKRGSRPKIDVQIDPAAQQAALAAAAPQDDQDSGSEPSSPVGQYTWFWERVSPSLTAASAGRIETAVNAVAGPSSTVTAPRLQDMQNIAKAWGVDILTATLGTNVSPALVLAVISVESAGRVDAKSSAGAQGLMQLIPATAERFGVSDALSGKQNIQGGVKYLDWLMSEFDSDPIFALAGYNAGEGAVRKHDGVPPYAETRDYVPKVIAAFQVAKGLCVTPPQLASDGCVFTSLN